MRTKKSNRPHHANRSHRASVEPLDPRRLLSAAVVDPATELLRQRVWDTAGVSTTDANEILAAHHAHADAAAGLDLSDVGYLSPLSRAAANAVSPTLQAVQFESFAIDTNEVADVLRAAKYERKIARRDMPILMLPTPEGGVARFGIERYDLLAPNVAAQFPSIQSVRIYGLDDSMSVGTATLTSVGLTAFVTSPEGDWQVSPLDERTQGTAHASYFQSHLFSSHEDGHFECAVEGDQHFDFHGGPEANPDALIALGQTRRTYRFAFGTTAEYTAIYGNQAVAYSSVVARIGTGNAIFLRDFNASLTIVSTTATVFTNAATDGYTNSDPVAMLDQNTTVMNANYGSGAYDLGHVFGQASGISGVASLASIGQSTKARGSSTANPLSGDYNVVVFHEIGHSFGAPHTFNRADADQRNPSTAYEPGPGSTMMSYGSAALGYLGSFVTFNENYFHHNSIDRVENYLATIPTVGTSTTLTNRVPIANAGPDRSIPAFTPFELSGQAYDDQGNDLTYTWEQYDLGPELLPGIDVGTGPLFRSREGTRDITRSFPEVADVLASRTDADEFTPVLTRTADPLTFRLTVKDQLGGVGDDVIELPVVSTGAAFAITSQNSTLEFWTAGSTQTITWNVAGTTANGINTPLVDIYISYDGGTTFTPMFFGANNDGSQQVTVPTDAPDSGNARVKVKGRDNYFYDINNFPIIIDGQAPLNGLPTTAPAAELPIYSDRTGDIKDNEYPLMGANPNIDFIGDTDTYLYSPPVTAPYIITAGRSGGSSVDTVLCVYDDLTGVPLAINDDFEGSTATSRVVVGMEAGKRYRISIGDFGSDTAGEVFLTLQGTELTPFASTISLNAAGDGSTTGTLFSSRSANFHPFAVPALYDGTGTISITAPEASTVLSLYDASDNLVAFTTTGTLNNLTNLTKGHTYNIRVGTHNYASGGGNYTLNVNLGIDAPLPATLSVADGTIAFHAPTQDSFDAHSPDIFIVSPDEVDARYLAPTVDVFSRTGDIEVIGGTLNPTVAIYSATTGARLAIANGTGVGSTARIDDFVFNPNARYILAVSGLGNTTGNPNVRVLMDSMPFTSTNVTLDSAGDGSAAFNFPSLSIGQSFRIVAPVNALGFVTFEADPDAASDVELYLFNAAGDELAVSQSGGPNASEAVAQLFVPPGTEFFATVIAQNYAGGSTAATGTFRVNFDTPAPPPAPPAPELLPADDTGVSNSDRITFKNTNLGIVVNAPTGQFIRLFRDGVQVAGPTAVGVTTFLTLNDPASLADGLYDYTATAAATASSTQSPASPPISVQIDTSAPLPDGFSFRFDDGAQDHSFFVDYNQAAFDFVPSDITVRNLTTNQTLPSSSFNLSVGGSGLNDLFYNPTAGNDRVPSGNYEISIAAGAATDVAGNPIAARIENFFFLDADANRDRAVNITDFAILASRFNQSGTFRQGDFDYNGAVNISDFALLASRFNTSLPAPANLPRQSGESLRPERSVFSQRVIDEEEQLTDLVG